MALTQAWCRCRALACRRAWAQVRGFYTQEGMTDCAWNESNENQLVTVHNDHSVKVWDLTTPDDFPIANLREHREEVVAVHWNLVDKRLFLTGSWDSTAKVWQHGVAKSIATFSDHRQSVYDVKWNPRHASVLATVAGDRTIRVFDMKGACACADSDARVCGGRVGVAVDACVVGVRVRWPQRRDEQCRPSPRLTLTTS